MKEGSPDFVTLEQLVDRHGLQHVLDTLGAICEGKAEHLRTNWQAVSAGDNWTRAARAVELCAGKPAVQMVSA